MKHEILIYNKTKRRIPEKFINSVILKALNFLKLKQPVELAVLVVDRVEIKRLNKIWRGKNELADELSFGLNSRQVGKTACRQAENNKKQNKVLELGEIVINNKKIRDKKYLTKILIHSLLHLLGYDHEKSTLKAKKMEYLEEKIFKFLNTKY